MGLLEEADVRKLMQDSTFMTEIAKAMAENPETLDSLAEDIADELEDELEDNPALRQKIVEGALASPEFKKKVLKKLVDDLD